MLRKCIHGGGDNCSRQGGDGYLHHGEGYVHPYPTLEEVGQPIGEFVSKSHPREETHSIFGFEIDFDEDKSYSIMTLELSKSIDVEQLVKSLYDFDLETLEGVRKLLGLLPILDSNIVLELVEKIWVGYAVEEADPELLREEVKGYLLDYLEENNGTI